VTCIAWDGRWLAADGLSTCGDQIINDDAVKLFRVHHPDHGPMMAGLAGMVPVFAHWLKELGKEGFPAEAADMDDACGLFVDRRGGCWTVYANGLWTRLTGSYAQGSGGLLALTVLRDGGSAVDAVRFASRHSTSCGGTIRVYDWKANGVMKLRN